MDDSIIYMTPDYDNQKFGLSFLIDENCNSPREKNVGKMCYFSKTFENYSEIPEINTVEQLHTYLKTNSESIALPIYEYSGYVGYPHYNDKTTLNHKPFDEFSKIPIGYIIMDVNEIIEKYGDNSLNSRKLALYDLMVALHQYDAYINDNVFAYEIADIENHNIINSGGDYYLSPEYSPSNKIKMLQVTFHDSNSVISLFNNMKKDVSKEYTYLFDQLIDDFTNIHEHSISEY